MLLALPMLVKALPAGAAPVTVDTLAERIAHSSRQPYEGFAVSSGAAGLPSLPQLDDVIGLFDGDTSLRIWYASPTRWRVDTVSTAGERDLYRSTDGETIWDSGRQQFSTILGTATVHLPRGADLVPADLARRLLSSASTGTARSALPARRVAGIDAAGIRLTPTGFGTTVSRVDIWADPATGLPVQVDVYADGMARPALSTRLLDLRIGMPAPATTAVPVVPAGIGHSVTSNPDVFSALRALGGTLPDSLGGLHRNDIGGPAGSSANLPGIGAYGSGFGQVIAAALPRRTGFRAFRAARDVGGTVTPLNGGMAVVVSTPLLNVLIVDVAFRGVYIVVGPVGTDVLDAAAAELAIYAGPDS